MIHSSQYNLTDPDVIAAHQRGEIMPVQRVGLGSDMHFKGLVALAFAFLIVLVLCVLEAAAFIAQRPNLTGMPADALAIIAIPILVAGAWGAFATLFLARFLLIRHELSTGQVKQAEGQVVWKGQNYAVKIPGRRLKFLCKLNLLPGSYRFFYLPRTGWLLSAERLTGVGEEQTMRDLLKILAQANHFSLTAVAVNRAGRLADDQIWRLVRPMVDYVIVGLFTGCMALGVLYSLSIGQRDWAIVSGGFGALGLLLLGIRSTLLLKQDLGSMADARARQVTLDTGDVKAIEITGEATSYYYQINRQRFAVSHQGYNALIAGIPYRLYYAPRSKKMVSIEPLAPLLDATGRPEP